MFYVMEKLSHSERTQIKNAIAKGNTEAALILLMELAGEKAFQKEVLMLNSRYSELRSKQLKGIISEQDLLLQHNRIKNGIIELLETKMNPKSWIFSANNGKIFPLTALILLLFILGMFPLIIGEKKSRTSSQDELIDILDFQRNEINENFSSLNQLIESSPHFRRVVKSQMSDSLKAKLKESKNKYNQLVDWEIASIEEGKMLRAAEIRAMIHQIPEKYQIRKMKEMFFKDLEQPFQEEVYQINTLERAILSACPSHFDRAQFVLAN